MGRRNGRNGRTMRKKRATKISGGNSKLGPIPNLSLAPGVTCTSIACETCLMDCYARNFYRMYKNVRKAWDTNTKLALEDLPTMERELNEYFSGLASPKFFRVHVAGDFVSLDYAEMWARVASAAPTTKFLAFTKSFDIVQKVSWPDNFKIVYSAWPGVPAPPAGRPVAWMDDGTETRIPARSVHCPGNCESCGMCWSLDELGKDVYFSKH
jgi:hypothetical protein